MMQFDYSTINRVELEKLPVYEKPNTFKISNHLGNGCFLDVPGYPSYFTQSIYNSRGNTPRYGPEYIILGRELPNDFKEREEALEKLYIKLPYNHPRVKAWEENLYTYFNKCYVDDRKGNKAMNAGEVLIWPVPYYQLKSFNYPYNYRLNKAYHASKELRLKARERMETDNQKVIDEYRKICIPENHDAYRHILKVYPDAKPRLDLIKNPLKSTPNWYERLSKKPEPDECPGEQWKKHPVNGSWCQVCGWKH